MCPVQLSGLDDEQVLQVIETLKYRCVAVGLGDFPIYVVVSEDTDSKHSRKRSLTLTQKVHTRMMLKMYGSGEGGLPT